MLPWRPGVLLCLPSALRPGMPPAPTQGLLLRAWLVLSQGVSRAAWAQLLGVTVMQVPGLICTASLPPRPQVPPTKLLT